MSTQISSHILLPLQLLWFAESLIIYHIINTFLLKDDKLWVKLWYLTIPTAHSSGIVTSSPLSSNNTWVTQSGPCLQSKLISSSFDETHKRECWLDCPFLDNGTSIWLHSNPQISFALLWTSDFHSLPLPWILTLESIKHDHSLTWITDSSAAGTQVKSLASRR